jgi:hypothetical protein
MTSANTSQFDVYERVGRMSRSTLFRFSSLRNSVNSSSVIPCQLSNSDRTLRLSQWVIRRCTVCMLKLSLYKIFSSSRCFMGFWDRTLAIVTSPIPVEEPNWMNLMLWQFDSKNSRWSKAHSATQVILSRCRKGWTDNPLSDNEVCSRNSQL